jgi:hypothetical protein
VRNQDLYHPCAIPGNIITNIDPIAAAALKFYPQPNTTPNAAGGGSSLTLRPSPTTTALTPSGSTPPSRASKADPLNWVTTHRLQPGEKVFFNPVPGTTLAFQNYGGALGYNYTITPETVLGMHATWTRFANQSLLDSQGLLNATSMACQPT